MKKATDVFGEWAENGKDIGMEEGHAISVEEMLNFSLDERALINKNFSFLDIGCGNGWVTRRVSTNSLCSTGYWHRWS
jgi:2-polyprenyl-3-methyl-5-hydroxy-6-metoxy-1,4-benzoquinol methylase